MQKKINNSKNKYSEAVAHLFEKQKREWPLLIEGLDALREVKTNKFLFNGFEFHTQYNPRRITSTTADVSTEAVKNRKCFLCKENLPEGQEGIAYQDKYSILFNPYPVVPEHLTITSTEHKPQRIKNSFSDMIRLSKDLPEFTMLYNGPESGASAPDHLHFQAVKKNMLPINNDLENLKNKYGEMLINYEADVFCLDDGLRKFILVESASLKPLNGTFRKIYNLYSQISKSHVEPMMNILVSNFNETGWKVIIFFRKKHRPDAYFKEGESNILVSPASIDLAGLAIVPLEKDFQKINREVISQVFNEVAVGKESFEYLKTKLQDLNRR
jgi:hypothetical protein